MSASRVENIVAFVPAKDYALSRRFYAELGFKEKWGGDDACEMVRDGFSFILQNYYVKEHAENCMMVLAVEDADSWWAYIDGAGLKQKYGLGIANPPAVQPWGRRVLYLTDPTGVLWHISDGRKE